jgi:hypothetical protein
MRTQEGTDAGAKISLSSPEGKRCVSYFDWCGKVKMASSLLEQGGLARHTCGVVTVVRHPVVYCLIKRLTSRRPNLPGIG